MSAAEMFELPSNVSWQLGQPEREAIQAGIFADRFDSLKDSIPQVRKPTKLQNIASVDSFDSVAPLMFEHTVYKSYPMSRVEKGHFDLLTKSLGGLSVHDLSGEDVSGCIAFDSCFEALEAQTPLRPNHTTGTSGKASVIPGLRQLGRVTATQAMPILALE